MHIYTYVFVTLYVFILRPPRYPSEKAVGGEVQPKGLRTATRRVFHGSPLIDADLNVPPGAPKDSSQRWALKRPVLGWFRVEGLRVQGVWGLGF